jgi:plastocyanin
MRIATIAAAALTAICLAGLPAQAEEVTVGQAGKTFNPADLQIKVGDSVSFNNDDTVTHAVLVKGPAETNLGPIKVGEAKSVTFDAPGTYDVKCAIHPKMKLTIAVQ